MGLANAPVCTREAPAETSRRRTRRAVVQLAGQLPPSTSMRPCRGPATHTIPPHGDSALIARSCVSWRSLMAVVSAMAQDRARAAELSVRVSWGHQPRLRQLQVTPPRSAWPRRAVGHVTGARVGDTLHEDTARTRSGNGDVDALISSWPIRRSGRQAQDVHCLARPDRRKRRDAARACRATRPSRRTDRR